MHGAVGRICGNMSRCRRAKSTALLPTYDVSRVSKQLLNLPACLPVMSLSLHHKSSMAPVTQSVLACQMLLMITTTRFRY